ncbi:MAG: hypothetical protein LBU61_03895 [Coriobacteriales bacterium]|nr:hypothetical protein [Coriobacteriales bacterium]
MQCKGCGREIADGSSFCLYCATDQDIPEPRAPLEPPEPTLLPSDMLLSGSGAAFFSQLEPYGIDRELTKDRGQQQSTMVSTRQAAADYPPSEPDRGTYQQPRQRSVSLPAQQPVVPIPPPPKTSTKVVSTGQQSQQAAAPLPPTASSVALPAQQPAVPSPPPPKPSTKVVSTAEDFRQASAPGQAKPTQRLPTPTYPSPGQTSLLRTIIFIIALAVLIANCNLFSTFLSGL